MRYTNTNPLTYLLTYDCDDDDVDDDDDETHTYWTWSDPHVTLFIATNLLIHHVTANHLQSTT